MTPTFEQLVILINRWADERGIYQHSTPQAQLLKAASEFGELCDAEVKADRDAQIDAVGDTMVCLINFCAMRDINITDALRYAYGAIKDRRGRMVPGGAFVKEE